MDADEPLTEAELHADCLGSYLDAIRAIGEAVRRGERELPEYFIPREAS